jgi:alkylation response protein AidB-like acyl-CoA dehydrogenase
VESGAPPDDALWARAAEVGWLGAAVPEAHGGTDLSAVSLATLMEEMGRALLPSPFLGTLLATLLIREAASAEQQARWLPAIAQGKLKAAAATLEADGGWDHGAVAATARRDGDRLWLSGAKVLVVDAPGAALVVGTFREEAGVSLFAVDPRAPGVRVSPEALVDPTRRSAHVELREVAVGEDARLGAPGEGLAALDRVMPRLLVALAAEMAGGADRALQITVDYAKVREQFGRPIGAFQAVKHPLVNGMVDVELTRSLVYRAAAAIDHAPPRAERLSRMAKALASDTYANAVAKAVQLHGGIGFTWECDVHLFFRRAQWCKAAFGDAAYHRRKIAELVLDG